MSYVTPSHCLAGIIGSPGIWDQYLDLEWAFQSTGQWARNLTSTSYSNSNKYPVVDYPMSQPLLIAASMSQGPSLGPNLFGEETEEWLERCLANGSVAQTSQQALSQPVLVSLDSEQKLSAKGKTLADLLKRYLAPKVSNLVISPVRLN